MIDDALVFGKNQEEHYTILFGVPSHRDTGNGKLCVTKTPYGSSNGTRGRTRAVNSQQSEVAPYGSTNCPSAHFFKTTRAVLERFCNLNFVMRKNQLRNFQRATPVRNLFWTKYFN